MGRITNSLRLDLESWTPHHGTESTGDNLWLSTVWMYKLIKYRWRQRGTRITRERYRVRNYYGKLCAIIWRKGKWCTGKWRNVNNICYSMRGIRRKYWVIRRWQQGQIIIRKQTRQCYSTYWGIITLDSSDPMSTWKNH